MAPIRRLLIAETLVCVYEALTGKKASEMPHMAFMRWALVPTRTWWARKDQSHDGLPVLRRDFLLECSVLDFPLYLKSGLKSGLHASILLCWSQFPCATSMNSFSLQSEEEESHHRAKCAMLRAFRFPIHNMVSLNSFRGHFDCLELGVGFYRVWGVYGFRA